jgi:hypothetical protein
MRNYNVIVIVIMILLLLLLLPPNTIIILILSEGLVHPGTRLFMYDCHTRPGTTDAAVIALCSCSRISRTSGMDDYFMTSH